MIRRSFDIFFNKSMTKRELDLSKAPVGSSARSSFGLLIIDLKIAILCFSPPLKSLAFLQSKVLSNPSPLASS